MSGFRPNHAGADTNRLASNSVTQQPPRRVHAQADLAVDQQNCLATAYSGQWLEYVTEERRSSTPDRQPDRVGRSLDTQCRNTSAESSG
jgi:hypothetical protein